MHFYSKCLQCIINVCTFVGLSVDITLVSIRLVYVLVLKQEAVMDSHTHSSTPKRKGNLMKK